jgi:FixJ family two-component response regulator
MGLMVVPPTIFIIDDDQPVREALALVLRLEGYRTRTYASGEEFLQECPVQGAGCAILDLRMPGMSGLDVQRAMADRSIDLPVIFMTAFGDVATTRAALKAGAADFLEKPVNETALLELVSAVVAKSGVAREAAAREGAVAQKLASLTVREREVFDRVVAGEHNREIAATLAISVRTVEVYKARMMAKLGVTRIPELMTLVHSVSAPAQYRA